MNEKKPPKDAHLNPDLHAERDDTYGPDQQGHDPMDNVSVKPEKHRAWPLIWAIVTVLCILMALYLFIP
ncbi:hypothetical protein [Microbulbifer marinus]|uniref:Uncharacterized protein n=1 Tax=Microbulbifer marinus TaxID=658218 RepID=A0A1H4BPM3_9GAMM|nr:hypothetical protein [Microbulbifer marinus]SEA50096.1 hypothetical protein SAMN05216562_3390 [Microbulbifer marinus]